MFSIGFPEFILVAAAMLIFVGPERLPQVARWCGRMIARGRIMILDIQRELERNAELQELRKTGVDIREDISGVVEEFGKISEEVSRDVKRLGESFSLDNAGSNSQDSPSAAAMEPGSEDDFQDEVEILRRARRVPGAEKVSSGGEPSLQFTDTNAEASGENG